MARIAVKNSIGSLTFDAILKVDHTSRLTVTEHPVESGANIADHAYMEPCEVTIEIGMSDAARQIGRGGSRSVSAYDALQKLQAQRKPITVVTRLKSYGNMLIESITAPDDYTTMYGLRATVSLREILMVSTKTVKVSPRNSTTNGGTKQPTDAAGNQSVLKQAAEKLGL